eukprot:scaffold181301_cov28-Tisochrysis_lutea.AAC.1
MRGTERSCSARGPPAWTTSTLEKRSCPFGLGERRQIFSRERREERDDGEDEAEAEKQWYLTVEGAICTPGRAWYREVLVVSHGAQLVES